MGSDIQLYAVGIVSASVCHPEETPVEDVLAYVNGLHHPGVGCGWQLSEDDHFATGQPNPCPCNQEAGRIHRLLVC